MAFLVQNHGIRVSRFRRLKEGDNVNTQINSHRDNRTVAINSRDYTQATGDSIGMQVTPNQTVTTTGEVFGAQFKPRLAAGISGNTVNGLGIDSEVKSGAGNLSDDLRGINVYLGATGSGTITGNAAIIRARAEIAATVTGQVCFADIENSEGAVGWEAFVNFSAALGTHTMTTNTDKTGNAKSGTIKVVASGTLYHIQLYANA